MSDPIIFPVPDPTVQNPKELNQVWFEWKEEKDEAASTEKGVPVFDTVLLAHVMGPGLMRSEMVHVVERKKPDGRVIENHRGYTPQIKAFKSEDAGHLAGTPLTELACLDAGLRATMKAIGVHSVEALAALSESAAPQVMGFHKFKTAAQAFLDQRAGQEPMLKLSAEIDEWKKRYATLEANHKDLVARVAEIESRKKKAA